MNIILCGLPRCGKTTIGRKLALELDLSFLDSDRMIEESYKRRKNSQLTCREIYQLEGECFFRESETEVIHSLGNGTPTVIALGGGTLLNPVNFLHLKQLGIGIYLNQNPELIWKRLQREKEKSFLAKDQTGNTFFETINKRLPLYESFSDFTIEASTRKISEIVLDIKELLIKSSNRYGW